MHRKLSLTTREKVLLYLLRPTREWHYNGGECGPSNTQEGIAVGTKIPIKHVSEAINALERTGLVVRAKNVHVNGGKRVRRTYLLSDRGVDEAKVVANAYGERDVRIVTRQGEVETVPVRTVVKGELDFVGYHEFVGALDRWDRYDLRRGEE